MQIAKSKMSLYSILSVVLLVVPILGGSGDINHECQTDEVAEAHLEKDPAVREHREKNEDHWKHVKEVTGGHTEKWDKKHGKGGRRRRLQGFDGHIDIPIIFHVLYNANSNPGDRVEEYSKFIDRLKNINLNFNEANADISTDPLWGGRAGNMDISFYINKIIYRNVGGNSPFTWMSDNIKSRANGGNDPIDEDHNLNIYFVRPTAANEWSSAYASFPWDDDTIGIVFNIGLINGVWAAFNWGQFHTIFSHEIGHWVGLYHIWGCCTAGDNPSCAVDDEVVDTANMGNKWGNQCPARGSNSCDGGDADNFENFMSYASCINMFTDGQVARARANFVAGGDRAGFIDYENNPTSSAFVNMIYFIPIAEECMIASDDTKKTIYSANNGGQYALCVSYSKNPHIDVYTDITIIQGSNTVCPNTYSKIDNNLKNGGVDYFVCFKKVAQTNPLSDDTVLDVDIMDLNVDINGAGNNIVIYDWPSCNDWCLTDYGGCAAAMGGKCHQIRDAIYRVNGACYRALTNCWGCLHSPNSYGSHLQPVTCPDICKNHCGGSAGACWCDSQCANYGDCCPGKEEVCGASVYNFYLPQKRTRPQEEAYNNKYWNVIIIGVLVTLLLCSWIYFCSRKKYNANKKQYGVVRQYDSESDVEKPINK